MYNCMIDPCLILLEFAISGNFPEIAWRAFKAARRLMLFSWVFWVPRRNRLAVSVVHQVTQADQPNFFGFWWTTPGDASQFWLDFDVFGYSRLFWLERMNLYMMMYWWSTINGWMTGWIELIGIKIGMDRF